MTTFNLSDDLKLVAKQIKKGFPADSIIQYLCNSAIRARDELAQKITIGMIHAHILDKYNFEIWKK